jgi:ADP-ribosyl-[dinitrogen reductase] hydrolase
MTTKTTPSPSLPSRIRGALFGLAVTDALGAPVEFAARGTFPLVTSMLENRNFNVYLNGAYTTIPAGSFTDDTSMALCLAHSFLDCAGENDSVDQARKYLRWLREGWMSSVGVCFDVGVSTRGALKMWEGLLGECDGLEERERRERIREIERKFEGEGRCGNGSLMRCLPCGLMVGEEEKAVELARSSSKTTHGHERCVDACEGYVRLVVAALEGREKKELAGDFGRWVDEGVEGVLGERLKGYKSVGDWKAREEREIWSSGYVVDSFEAALWAFFGTESFKEGAIRVVNLGDDADTVGAIYGGLAGAYYGVEEIPSEWMEKMRGTGIVEDVVQRILKHRGLAV